MGDMYEVLELEPPMLVAPANDPTAHPPYEIADDELVWPVIVTEADGTQWVQMVDSLGHFTGYDPSFEQIEAAVAATTTPENEKYRYARIATLVRTTVEMHDALAWHGGDQLLEYERLGDEEISLEMAEFLTDPNLWSRTFRRTQQARQGEQ